MFDAKDAKRARSAKGKGSPPVPAASYVQKPILLLILLPLVAVIGLILLGRQLHEKLRGDERYRISLSEVECMPPAGMERADFLAEVQYYSGLPDQLHLLENDLTTRLAAAFAKDPWVEKVQRVEIAPPRRVCVRLRYRTPVLAVPYAGQTRAVDRNGVLLPASASTDSLPVFQGTPKPPAGPAGTAWGDEAVEEAARNAAERAR
jgi:hypothetical protein